MDFKFLTDNLGRRAIVARLLGISNAAGSGQGNSVSVVVPLTEKSSDAVTPIWPTGLATYTVVISPSQACFWNITNKSASGFTVTLTPPSSSATLAAGTFDALIVVIDARLRATASARRSILR
jgi:hypothetical protein